MTSRLCLHLETTLFGALDSLRNFNDILRADDSSWNHWELEIERLRPLGEERITRVRDAGAAVRTDGIETVADRDTLTVAHVEQKIDKKKDDSEMCEFLRRRRKWTFIHVDKDGTKMSSGSRMRILRKVARGMPAMIHWTSLSEVDVPSVLQQLYRPQFGSKQLYYRRQLRLEMSHDPMVCADFGDACALHKACCVYMLPYLPYLFESLFYSREILFMIVLGVV